ncbi:UNVERIFIED_CONTAM: hypothetical protein FKN15_078404 [Acipenser sinensis]
MPPLCQHYSLASGRLLPPAERAEGDFIKAIKQELELHTFPTEATAAGLSKAFFL